MAAYKKTLWIQNFAIIDYKALNNLEPEYLMDLLKLKTASYRTRASLDDLLISIFHS